MTRSEILKLKPGPEMNALVAEKIFEFDVRVMTTTAKFAHAPDSVFSDYYIYQEGYLGGMVVERYSADITAAFKVLKKFKDYLITPFYVIVKNELGFNFQYWSENIPEAICKAALLATI
jgi:hypothetical protein